MRNCFDPREFTSPADRVESSVADLKRDISERLAPLDELRRIADTAEQRARLAEAQAASAKKDAVFSKIVSILSIAISIASLFVSIFADSLW